MGTGKGLYNLQSYIFYIYFNVNVLTDITELDCTKSDVIGSEPLYHVTWASGRAPITLQCNNTLVPCTT